MLCLQSKRTTPSNFLVFSINQFHIWLFLPIRGRGASLSNTRKLRSRAFFRSRLRLMECHSRQCRRVRFWKEMEKKSCISQGFSYSYIFPCCKEEFCEESESKYTIFHICFHTILMEYLMIQLLNYKNIH